MNGVPLHAAPGWRTALARRLTPADFTRAGLPVPLFFMAANTEDNARGSVVDIVSGAKASLIGTPVFTTVSGVRPPGAGSRTVDPRPTPVIRLNASSGLNFGAIRRLWEDTEETLVVQMIIRMPNMLATSWNGSPTTKIRSVLSRSLRNPTPTNTAVSGWTMGYKQTKAQLSTATYDTGAPYFSGNNGTAKGITTSGYGTGTYQTAYTGGPEDFKTLTLCFRRSTSFLIMSIADHFSNSAFGAGIPGIGASTGLFLDNGVGDFLVGCGKEPVAGATNIDFADMDIVSIGMWKTTGVFHKAKAWVSTILQPHATAFVAFRPREVLQRVAQSMPVNGYTLAAAGKVTRYVSSSRYAAIRPFTAGQYAGPGNVLSAKGRVYRVVRGGTPNQGTPDPITGGGGGIRTSSHAALPASEDNGTYRMCLEDLTGRTPEYAAPYIGNISGVSGGDTVLFLQDHDFSKLNESQMYRAFPSIYTQDRPIVIQTEEGNRLRSPSSGTSSQLVIYTSVFFDNTFFPAETMEIRVAGRAILNSARAYGGLHITSSGYSETHDTTLYSRKEYVTQSRAFTYSNADALPWPGSYDNKTDGTTGAQTPLSCIRMFGGALSGRTPLVGAFFGGVTVELYGVQPTSRRQSRGLTAANGSLDGAIEGRTFPIAETYTHAMRNYIKIIGGVPATPHVLDSSGMGASPTEYIVDSLRPRTLGFLRTFKGNIGPLLVQAATKRTDSYRIASSARHTGEPFIYQTGGSYLEKANYTRIKVKLLNPVNSGVGIRIHVALFAAASGVATLKVVYPDAVTGRSRVVRYDDEPITLQLISNNPWVSFGVSSPVGAALDIPLPSLGRGYIYLEVGSILNNITGLDSDIEILR